jgi:cytochrome c peroxidase
VKILKVLVLLLIGAAFICSSAFAGDAKRGKDLFNDPKLGGATSGKSCNSCHPGGKGLEDAGDRKVWKMMGKKFNSLEAVINWDIEKALHGSALDPKGVDMADLVAYIKSLKKD